jgi:hypothetical protein
MVGRSLGRHTLLQRFGSEASTAQASVGQAGSSRARGRVPPLHWISSEVSPNPSFGTHWLSLSLNASQLRTRRHPGWQNDARVTVEAWRSVEWHGGSGGKKTMGQTLWMAVLVTGGTGHIGTGSIVQRHAKCNRSRLLGHHRKATVGPGAAAHYPAPSTWALLRSIDIAIPAFSDVECRHGSFLASLAYRAAS